MHVRLACEIALSVNGGLFLWQPVQDVSRFLLFDTWDRLQSAPTTLNV